MGDIGMVEIIGMLFVKEVCVIRDQDLERDQDVWVSKTDIRLSEREYSKDEDTKIFAICGLALEAMHNTQNVPSCRVTA
ncbi:hypothetical protein BCON_0034g00320 [Botryotinia convoluta]|uniref:Uncharacterized protein n=1 Tax=Botryotinia convoluta TaxID=54673 RepID=A0A4Z1IGW9_9HELO|nr:hypothetical protein BCON_0034g00320 [Botryotinia convoluta]